MGTCLNKLVDKIFVLTIETNSDRHPYVEAILKNIEFEYWNGLDARKKFPNKKYVSQIEDRFFIENDVDREFASGSTIGQFGAYLSIKKMIDHVAQQEFEKVLIFEDDMLPLQESWQNIFKKALSQLPEDWDILLAGYFYDGRLFKYSHQRRMRVLLKLKNNLKALFRLKGPIPLIPKKYSKNLDISGYSMGGHSYCLSKKGAKILSENLNPMRDSGDLLVSRLIIEKKIKAFSVYPCLFTQNSLFTSKTNK
jgi:GR25 family glycosyltransferase involved in LPS biosynthesis